MDPMIVLLFSMEFVSIMLAVILATAWNSFGRPRHALTWCGAFVIAAIDWAGYLIQFGGYPDDAVLRFGVNLLSMTTWAVMLVGFRQRRGQRGLVRRTVAPCAAATAALAAAAIADHHGFSSAIPLLFSATTLAMSAGTMMRRPVNPAERPVVTMLLAFAMILVIAGGVALSTGAAGDAGKMQLFAMLMMLTLPSALIGTGLFAVFLLAADLADRMSRLAASDPLTRVLNRRGFEEAAARAVANARRQGQPLTIVVADIDRFKAINDRYGHAAGDHALCRFADHVGGSIRAEDLLGRIGGEEFALVLVDVEPDAAVDVIDRIRVALGRLEIATAGRPVTLTASFGVTGPSGADDTLATMLARADEALYQSKLDGRDRVTLAPSLAPVVRPRPVAAARARALSGTAAR